MGFFARVLFLLSVFVLWSSNTNAQNRPNPTEVEVGIWLNGIHDIDMPNGSFGVDFYIWWISRDSGFKPFEALQILNGRSWSVRSESRRILSNGLYYSSGIVSATISHDWNLRDFPFDEQELRILIETSSTASELVIVPNESKSAISDFANVQGYRLKFLHLQSISESYETDFGITEDSGNEFSRLTISVGLARESGRLVITLLIGFIVANIFSLLTYTIHGSNLAIRVAMCGGAIFAAVGNMYSLNSAFNPAAGSLLIDRFSVGSFAAIVAALSTAILIDHYYRRNKTRQARRINQLSFYTVCIILSLYYGYSFYQVM